MGSSVWYYCISNTLTVKIGSVDWLLCELLYLWKPLTMSKERFGSVKSQLTTVICKPFDVSLVMAEESEWFHECFFWYPLEEKQGSCHTEHPCYKDSKALELKSIKVRITPKSHLHKEKLNCRDILITLNDWVSWVQDTLMSVFTSDWNLNQDK